MRPDNEEQSPKADVAQMGSAGSAQTGPAPSIGRVVHYFTDGQSPVGAAMAAIVTAVHPGMMCSLHVMPAPGRDLTNAHVASVAFEVSGVPHVAHATPSDPYWTWPPRV